MSAYRQQITYNGFIFPYAKLSVNEQTKFGDDGITPIGTSFQFTVSGVLADEGSGLLTRLLSMRGSLAQPRRNFSVEWNDGSSWISMWSFTNGDDAFGPVPGQLIVRQISGGRCAMYSWSVEVFKKQCFGSDCSLQNPYSDVLSLSRQWDHTVDEAGYTTRTVSGTLRVKRNATTTADSWRALVIPFVPGWYKRTNQSFTQTPDGMELNYSITDVEQHWTLPKPVIKGHATYSVKLNPLSMLVTHTLSGEFAGSTSATKFDLYTAMSNLLIAKFPSYDGTQVPTLIFQTIDVSESVYENSISFTISGEVAGGGDQDFNAALLRFYVAPPGADGAAQAPNAYGSSGSGFSSGIMSPRVVPYDACGAAQAGPNAPLVYTTPVGTGTIPVPTAVGNPDTPTAASRPTVTETPPASSTSADHDARPYLEYRETLSYEVNNRIATFLPKADDANARPFTQRTGTPTMTIIQAGYWVRATKDNSAFQLPKPYGYDQANGDGTPQFVILSSSISPQNAEPMGASGWFRVTLHWKYVIKANYRLDDTLSGSIYNPRDPRHKTPITPAIEAADSVKIVERLTH